MMAMVQVRRPSAGQAYYRRKLVEGKGTVASGPKVPPRDSKVEALPVRTAVKGAQSDQS
jgi:hypothetical protein